ncbi:MAG: hypothetical protein ACPL4I_13070 [Bacteroidota bacterium]
MTMTTIQFYDIESGNEAIAVIRAVKAGVGLCLSIKDDGDVEVFLSVSDCKRLAEALWNILLSSDDEK